MDWGFGTNWTGIINTIVEVLLNIINALAALFGGGEDA